MRGFFDKSLVERCLREGRSGLKRMDTPILKGTQIYHNVIKPHEGLHGRTPAEAAGIRVVGEDKWKTLIQNATGSEQQR